MKKLFLASVWLAMNSITLMAGPCSTTMSFTQLGTLGSTGCEFAGYNFSNFNISGYIDLATTASNGYNFVDHHTPGDNARDNYLVTFSSTSATGFQVAFTGKVLQTDGRVAWSLDTGGSADASSNFGFTANYHINNVSGGPNVKGLDHITATVAGVVYTGAGGADATTSLVKTVSDGNSANSSNINAKIFASSGSSSTTLAVPVNNTGTLIVNDVFFEQITNVANAHLTTGSVVNGFDAPEPMTLGLMGFGLAGLFLLRRRTA